MPLISTKGGGSASTFGFFSASYSSIIATGGTITEYGIYRLHTFTGSGTFNISKVGNSDGAGTYDFFGLGAGSAGVGGQVHVVLGAGGAAGIKKGSNGVSANTGSFPITIGSGGTLGAVSQVSSPSNAGNSSTFFGQTANGGNGLSGQSRTGASNSDFSGATVNVGQGTGGGAGAGGNASAANGGAGASSSIDGTNNVHGGGGAGGIGSPGSGGGGPFGFGGSTATANRGSGGGGVGANAGGGSTGADGVLFIRYQIKAS